MALVDKIFRVVGMADAVTSIKTYYGSNDIVGRILSALKDAGHDVENLTAETLNLADQIHGGGLNSTITLAELAGVSKGSHVLDAGCGVGCGARYLAHHFNCQVEAVDLTPEFVEAAAQLNTLCGLQDAITVSQGSVTDLRFEDGCFDLVWSQNVTMNVEDKTSMFSEVFRVLKPGGRFTFSHAANGPNGEPYYPLGWAADPSFSFMETPEIILELLDTAGFKIVENQTEGRTPGSSRGRSSSEMDGVAIIMGADSALRRANGVRSGEEGRIVGMMVVAERPQ
ncbi:MAG: SAM-dependent methyltransferase [Rhodospirillaceae bacterium]|nr:SAM-dependent methyltransferase [Rhodospirillaceae bacterium]|tara:strand:+ start:12595 stop:13443 length:849 start_codon:yes stop_codon:yes gene_type:complete